MNKFKYTKIGQMVDVLKTHSMSALAFSLLWMAFIMIWTNTVGSYVFAFIAIVSYFFSIFGCGERAAKNDKKSYVTGDPELKKGVYIPLLLLAVNLIFIALYKITWVFGSNGESIQELWSVITNVISYAWFAPFGSFSGMDKGNFSIIGIILIIIVPQISYFLGYLAGMKGYDISEKLFGFMYEKKKGC